MIKWTTPNLKCTIPQNLEFDYILLTLMQSSVEGIKLEKRIESEEVTDGVFMVNFSQEETGMFAHDKTIEAQLNIIAGDMRMATNIVKLQMSKNLHNEVIENA